MQEDASLVLFYVKNTTDIVMYDVAAKKAKLIGSSPNAILALNVSLKGVREPDLARMSMGNSNDPE